MKNGWTPERRARQSALIQAWRPWERATGPRTDEGKARTCLNGFKGGQWKKIRELNKALNDMVHVARANAGLDRLSDRKGEAEPSQRLIARLRRQARVLPFHRLYHSVELTMLAFATAVIGLFLPALVAERWLLLILLPFAVLALGGHFVAIMASKRVRF